MKEEQTMPEKINDTESLSNLVRTEYRNLQMHELLHLSPHVLLGVSPKAENILKALDIQTLFDLATANVFDTAMKLLHASQDVLSALRQHGKPTSDMVRDSIAAGKKTEELCYLPVEVLVGIPLELSEDVKEILDVETVRD